MTDLRCSVYNCANQKDGCCKPNIKVEGEGACTCTETCCGSFTPKGTENAVVGYSTPNETVQISCDVSDCAYNKENKCRASNVSINSLAGTAGCSTFTKK